MVGTTKRSLKKQVLQQDHVNNWDLFLLRALYGYRLCRLQDGFSPFELLYGVPPRMHPGYQASAAANYSPPIRQVELAALASLRASHALSTSNNISRKPASSLHFLKVGDKILVAHGFTMNRSVKPPPPEVAFLWSLRHCQGAPPALLSTLNGRTYL